jgi:hypothetical protein
MLRIYATSDNGRHTEVHATNKSEMLCKLSSLVLAALTHEGFKGIEKAGLHDATLGEVECDFEHVMLCRGRMVVSVHPHEFVITRVQ